jgi:MFS family permease
MPTGNMWIIEVSPESIRGKLVGKANTAVFVAMFLSPILIQPIIKVSSLSGAFIFMGFALIAFIGILMYLKANQYKHTKTAYCKKNIRKTGS